jgi:myo-inositol 2-dehydrogenase/D-chiro-inositol 1-dehydrogenase
VIRIGILGCGRIARVQHLVILSGSRDVEVAALADPDESALRAASAIAGRATGFRDWRGVLVDPSIEAVLLCLPTGLHAEAARAAFEAGKHVYLEKPVATRAEDAAAVAGAWRNSGKTGMMGFSHRFHPAVVRAREAIRRGAIGPVVGARMASTSPPRELPSWKRRRADGGGAALDLLSHHADLARFLFDDEVTRVTSSIRSLRSEDDDASSTLTMAGGTRVESRVSFTGARENRFEVVGASGVLTVDRVAGRCRVAPTGQPGNGRARFLREARRLVGLAGDWKAALAPRRDPSYRLALTAFVHAVRDGSPVQPDIADGERSLAVVLAAEDSAREGRPVAIAPVPA